ncbi:E3 ubiquitin-protein ligase BIG BROTHER-like [Salvia splendens]|uniref:E3 ubiquitin-protein ligase BIG BROTHER-like n=1 Tax=Salvia splendens TaxID=180675 RepID=UPI001C255385|nr:E3 ubiquitin-protein ligase BIG BROTHER-like [Salvia splendens]
MERENRLSAAEYLKWILPDLEGLDAQEVLKQQESAYEYYNFGQRGFEHGESSNFIDEYDIDEALARSLMMLDVEDQFSPPNTRSNVTEVHVVETPLEHDHDIDPDTMSYEQLQSLGDAVGHESKGLSEKDISKLRTSSFKVKSSKKKEEEDKDE